MEAICEHDPRFSDDDEEDEAAAIIQNPATTVERDRHQGNDSVREDFLVWSGGFPPESAAQISSYIEAAIPADADPKVVRQFLTAWMNEPD